MVGYFGAVGLVADLHHAERGVHQRQHGDEPPGQRGRVPQRRAEQAQHAQRKKRRTQGYPEHAAKSHPAVAGEIAPVAQQGILHRVEDARGQQQATDGNEIQPHHIGIELGHVHVDGQGRHRQRNGGDAVSDQAPGGYGRG